MLWTVEMLQLRWNRPISQTTITHPIWIDNLNNHIKDIGFIILKSLEKKSLGPDGFTGEFHKTFKKN